MKYFPLTPRTVLSIRGADRTTLLQRLCTQDLRNLPHVGFQEAFLTDVKGKTLAHGWIIDGNDQLLLVVASDVAVKLVNHLDRYIIREDVTPVDQSGSWSWMAIDSTAAPLLDLQFGTERKVAQTDSLIGLQCDAYTSKYFVVGTTSDDLPEFQARLIELGIQQGTDDEREWLRIQGGWPEFGSDFDSNSLPQEINRDREAISFTKGCYLGQETVARLDALGQVQKKLCRMKLPQVVAIEPGTKIGVGETEVGWVTSSARCPRSGESILFGFVKRQFWAPSTPLSIDGHSATFL